MLYKIRGGGRRGGGYEKHTPPSGIWSPSWEKTRAIHHRCLRGLGSLKGHSVNTPSSNPPAWILCFGFFFFGGGQRRFQLTKLVSNLFT